MYGEQQGEGARMARWLAEREQRIQALEAENRALRLQLERLRQGVGIALVIEGRVVPMAPSSSGIIASAPVPTVAHAPQAAPHIAATQPHAIPQPIPQPIPHPPVHATGTQPVPHWSRHEDARPTWPPLAETPAQLPVVGPLTPTSPVSAIGKWGASPRAAIAPMPAPAPRPEPRWFEDDAPEPAPRESHDPHDGNFLL
jgi:hypothetical protein